MRTFTDPSTSVTTNKTISIDTNNQTLTLSDSINSIRGTLTIKGSGTISTAKETVVARTNGGNIITSGTPTISSINGTALIVTTSGNINVKGGYIWSSSRAAIASSQNSTGAISIQNGSYVYTPCQDKSAISIGGSGNISIIGSYVGNANEAKNGSGGGGESGATAINIDSTSTLTVTDSKIYSGKYGGAGITRRMKGAININGNSSVYANNNDGKCAVSLFAQGSKLTINTTGELRSTHTYAIYSSESNTSITVTKGRLDSLGEYKSYNNGSKGLKYTGQASQLTFYYMNNYKIIESHLIKKQFYTYTK